MSAVKMKKCPPKIGCGRELPEDDDHFYRTATGKFRRTCKECVKKARNKYYRDHREEHAKRSAQYYKDNTEKAKQLQKEYYKRNQEKLIEKALKRYTDRVKKEKGREVVHTGPHLNRRVSLANAQKKKAKR